MGFPLELAFRYMGSKKRSFISMGTFFAILGVALGVAGLATAMSVTGGFRKEFRDKVLGVNAHVLILKRSSSFTEYRELMREMEQVKGVTGIAPFTINPMMVTRGDRTATGVMLKGVDPDRVGDVLDLPKHMIEGSLKGLRLPGAKPPLARRSRRLFEEKTSDPSESPDFLDQLSKLVEQDRSAADSEDNEEGEAILDVLAAGHEEIEQRAGTPSGEEATEGSLANLPNDAIRGTVVPEGGYQSVLPTDDILPEELSSNPCEEGAAGIPGIVIGITLSKNLDAKLGDCVQVTSPTIGFSISGGAVRPPVAKQFRVTGIFSAGFDQYDSKFVYTDMYQAQEFAENGDSVTGIEMKVEDIDDARAIARQIDERLGSSLHYTMDWEELNHGLFTALRIQQVVMSLVLALIIILAAFTVIATLIMVVLDKKKEIAVLKSMGATDSAILRAFLYQGGIVGVVGALFGLALAVLVCRGILVYGLPLDPKVYFISHLPVDFQALDFILVGIFAVLVCLLATVWPAMHAARLRPAEAFREG
jgi:lipoprotein-releasing system permease protein